MEITFYMKYQLMKLKNLLRGLDKRPLGWPYWPVGRTLPTPGFVRPHHEAGLKFNFSFSVVKNNHRPVGVNSKSDVEIRKQRDAIKKDLQKKMDLRWDKDTRSDRSR
jgi:hypothetical protein